MSSADMALAYSTAFWASPATDRAALERETSSLDGGYTLGHEACTTGLSALTSDFFAAYPESALIPLLCADWDGNEDALNDSQEIRSFRRILTDRSKWLTVDGYTYAMLWIHHILWRNLLGIAGTSCPVLFLS